jgi:hypothetical protein
MIDGMIEVGRGYGMGMNLGKTKVLRTFILQQIRHKFKEETTKALYSEHMI